MVEDSVNGEGALRPLVLRDKMGEGSKTKPSSEVADGAYTSSRFAELDGICYAVEEEVRTSRWKGTCFAADRVKCRRPLQFFVGDAGAYGVVLGALECRYY